MGPWGAGAHDQGRQSAYGGTSRGISVLASRQSPDRPTCSCPESLGHERHILCDLPSEETVIVRIGSDMAAPAAGSEVRLSANPEHLHFFDPQTTRRLD